MPTGKTAGQPRAKPDKLPAVGVGRLPFGAFLVTKSSNRDPPAGDCGEQLIVDEVVQLELGSGNRVDTGAMNSSRTGGFCPAIHCDAETAARNGLSAMLTAHAVPRSTGELRSAGQTGESRGGELNPGAAHYELSEAACAVFFESASDQPFSASRATDRSPSPDC